MAMPNMLVISLTLVAVCVAMPSAQLAKMKRSVCSSADVSGCNSWAAIGYCHSGSIYHDFMMSNCQAACEICEAPPTTPPPPPPPPSNVAVVSSECLGAHNNKRALHQNTPNLSWNADMATEAAAYALKLAQTQNFVHSDTSDGENLYNKETTSGTVSTCQDAVDSWYSEIDNYDYTRYTNHPGGAIGHFTQIVWKSTTEVGVGVAKAIVGGWTKTYIVARYRTAGNVKGQSHYDENVKPLS
ncbi:protein PRY2 [Nematostella vectensis]|uniref:protein PRY2 n=1 Tax=Nematostella vectensis TaxID=45351 RepID=UPI002077769C|nr:protein PRY2 [Nematostella vectensis]